MSYTETITEILDDKSYQFAYLLILVILIVIVAWKEGLKEWVLIKLNMNKTADESLVSGRGEPDFWVIGNELAESRREHMGVPLSLYEKRKLVSIL